MLLRGLAAVRESGQDSGDRVVLFDAGQSYVQALEFEAETPVVDTQTVEDRGVQVVNVYRVGDDVVAEIVGLAVDDAGLDPGACHPEWEALGVMVAPVVIAGEPP